MMPCVCTQGQQGLGIGSMKEADVEVAGAHDLGTSARTLGQARDRDQYQDQRAARQRIIQIIRTRSPTSNHSDVVVCTLTLSRQIARRSIEIASASVSAFTYDPPNLRMILPHIKNRCIADRARRGCAINVGGVKWL